LAYVNLLHGLPSNVLRTCDALSRLHRSKHRATPYDQLRLGIERLLLHELAQLHREHVSLLGERRVATEALIDVVLALAVPREVDRPRNDVEVIEEEHDAAGQEAIQAVGDDLSPNVKDLNIRVVVLSRQAQGFVGGLVVLNTLCEIYATSSMHAAVSVGSRLDVTASYLKRTDDGFLGFDVGVVRR